MDQSPVERVCGLVSLNFLLVVLIWTRDFCRAGLGGRTGAVRPPFCRASVLSCARVKDLSQQGHSYF